MAQINIKKNTSASVSTPPAGVQALFIGTDSILYGKSDAGAVTQLAGLTGPSGSAGSSGTSGASGANGSSGTSGVNGNSGSSGTSGANGSSGSSGTSGQGGSSGTSGTSPGGGASPIALLNTNQLGSFTIGATVSNNPDFSIAIGYNANGKNIYSDADRGAIAIGRGSISSGRETLAIGDSAHAAQGNGCIAIGKNAGGGSGVQDSAVGIGVSTTAISGGSVAIGYEAYANGNYAICIGGNNPINYGHCSVTIGGQSGMRDNDFCEESVTIGWQAKMKKSYAIAIGGNAIATATYSTAIGYNATASHIGSVALGNGMTSSVSNHTHIKSLFINSVPVYADNTTAVAGGLIAGQVYRTSTGTLMITY